MTDDDLLNGVHTRERSGAQMQVAPPHTPNMLHANNGSPDSTAAADALSSPSQQTEDAAVAEEGGEEEDPPLNPFQLPVQYMEREEQRTEWLTEFLHHEDRSAFHPRSVHRSVDHRGLKGCALRGLYWRVFLGILDQQALDKWGVQVQGERRRYEQLAEKYNLTLKRVGEGEAEAAANPAPAPVVDSSPTSNPDDEDYVAPPEPPAAWFAPHADDPVAQIIHHDVERTYADQDFFIHPLIKQMMFQILLIWSKEEGKEEAGRYRQGMNELLAPILLVVARESQKKEEWKNMKQTEEKEKEDASASSSSASTTATPASPSATSAEPEHPLSPVSSSAFLEEELLPQLLDRDYIEHDTYALFRVVMKHMAPFFAKTESSVAMKKKAGPGDTSDPAEQTPIVKKCLYVHHVLLSTLDPQLYAHLNKEEVAPTIYILRWYRCLFSREFHMEDCLLIWDVLFATVDRFVTPQAATPAAGDSAGQEKAGGEGATSPKTMEASATADSSSSSLVATQHEGFDLAEFICLAMLLYVRQALMQGDNSYIFRRLLRYPPVEDIRVIIARALTFFDSWRLWLQDSKLETFRVGRGGHLLAEADAPQPSLRPPPTADLHAYEGPWRSVSSDMGADAPLDGPPRSASGSSKVRGSAAGRGGARRSPTSPPTLGAKALIQDGFATLKSFVKGAVANKSEGGGGKKGGGGAADNGYNSFRAHSDRLAAKKHAHATLPANRGGLPTTTGVSHFLAPSSTRPSNTPSASASPPAVASAIVSGPTEAQHDELIMLRKQLAKSQKENTKAAEAAHLLAKEVQDMKSMQLQMGKLMQINIQQMEAAQADKKEGEESTSAASTSSSFAQNLSELKHLQDVLLGTMTLAEALDKLQPASSPAASDARESSTDSNTENTNGTDSKEKDASTTPSSRSAILSTLRDISKRQQEAASRADASPSPNSGKGSSSAAGSSFPYSLPPAPSKQYQPLFEAEEKPRDKVSELFQLDEDDAPLPGLYPSIHTLDQQAEAKRQEEEEEQRKKELEEKKKREQEEKEERLRKRAEEAAKSAAETASLFASIPPPSSFPSASPTSASSSTSTPPLPSSSPTASSNPVSTVSNHLLDGLLDAETDNRRKVPVRSLFDNTPPDSPKLSSASNAGAKKGAAGSHLFSPALLLEEEDDDLLLPSAHQFKPAQPSFKLPSSNPLAQKAAAQQAKTNKDKLKDPLASLMGDDDDDDPLSWMGTGKKR